MTSTSSNRRACRWRLPIITLGLLLVTGCETLAPTPPLAMLQGLAVLDSDARAARVLRRYGNADDHKAAALALDTNGALVVAMSHDQPHELAAVRAAVAACELHRAELAIAAPCEVFRLGNEEFELGRALRHRTAADQPDTPTLLWRFRQGDAVLYVAGSMHAQRPSALPLAPALENAYRDASHLLVELDLATLDPAETQRVAREHSLPPAGTTLESLLGAERLAPLRRAADRLGVPWQTLMALRAGSAMAVLALSAIQSAGFEPSLGVDALLLGRARNDGKHVQALERYADQVALLSSAPQGDDASALAGELDPSAMRASVQRLFDAWLRADSAAVMRAFGVSGTPATPATTATSAAASDAREARWTERLLDQRNRRMTDHALSHLRSGQGTALLLVGTAHLPGPNGIVALLEQAGFAGEQLSRGGAPLAAGHTAANAEP